MGVDEAEESTGAVEFDVCVAGSGVFSEVYEGGCAMSGVSAYEVACSLFEPDLRDFGFMHQSFEGHHRDIERVAELSKAVEISIGYGFFEPSVSVVFEGSSGLDRVVEVVSGTRGVVHDVDVVSAGASYLTEPVDVFGDGPREVVFDGDKADG